jgi:hypothetical protein
MCCEKIPLQDKDCICDIGCGDGRVLIRWAELLSSSSLSSTTTMNVSFLGIDIDPNRINESREAVIRAKQEGRILPQIDMQFICGNALECCWNGSTISSSSPPCCSSHHPSSTTTPTTTTILQQHNVTIFFLYLIPRGLKQIYPILLDHVVRTRRNQGETTTITKQSQQQYPIRVVTYMSMLPPTEAIKPVEKAICHVPHQKDAAWPIYFYEL